MNIKSLKSVLDFKLFKGMYARKDRRQKQRKKKKKERKGGGRRKEIKIERKW